MKTILALTMFATALIASETSLDMYGFGLSYHTNRNVDWNEKNYGLGVGITYTPDNSDGGSLIVLAGGYKDSYNDNASFALIGMNQLVYGEKNKFHANIMLAGGYYNGSGFNNVGVMAGGTIGYDRFDLCFTGMPPFGDKTGENNDPKKSSSGFVAAFIKIRVLDF